MTRMLQIVLVGCAVCSLAACTTIRNAAGLGKVAPDEFSVVSKAPLIIPPDYNLRPPTPGSAPINEVPPTEAAQTALFGSPAAASGATEPAAGGYSQGEQALLMAAHVERANPGIRQQIQSDEAAMQGADDGFTNSLLFWQAPQTSDSPVDPNATTTTTPATPQDTPPQKESSGWFDWF